MTAPHPPHKPEPVLLPVSMLAQPDDFTCGPTCLQAVYRFYHDPIKLEQLVKEVPKVQGGGTLAVLLGEHALRRGYAADLFTFNLNVFDPTWFVNSPGVGEAAVPDLAERLRKQAEFKSRQEPKLIQATEAYLRFLELGGHIRFDDLSTRLLVTWLRKGRPILCGLSSTYLYRSMREWGPDDVDDDIRGQPQGHFVVICGYDPNKRLATVADPLRDNPGFRSQLYQVPIARLVAAIMLGVLTYDANLLILHPPHGTETHDPVPPTQTPTGAPEDQED
jgi:hypothetical protein